MAKTFTKEELQKYDGQDGRPAYIAIDGKVYDVSEDASWQGGKHHGYTAGQDLTKPLKRRVAHGDSVLPGIPGVGDYIG